MELQDSIVRRVGLVMVRLLFEFHLVFGWEDEEENGLRDWRRVWGLRERLKRA